MPTIIQRLRGNPDFLAVALLCVTLGFGSHAFQTCIARTRAELPFRARIQRTEPGPRWVIEGVRTRIGRLQSLDSPRPTRLPAMEF